ncbi:arsenite methyltransferase-like [Oppia nitens]|uniref:arsenite methyltransferase-like n=1 Tax=Oppia nitens TaxID=1686743 RepID=UPI0023DA2013|nr:arsenite methyltransferase-like [Oppia nitens]
MPNQISLAFKDQCCKSTVQLHTSAENDVHEVVRQHYAKVVTSDKTVSGDRCGANGSCFAANVDANYAKKLGYTKEQLADIPNGANLGLGCGNPSQMANIKAGHTVLDMGSGAGFDSFIVARVVGPTGQVIGIDMIQEMVDKAQANALKSGHQNVEFRLGQIEDMPVDTETIDVIISNCVINLVPNKAKAFTEAYRVLRPNGRLAISDLVTTTDIPDNVRRDLALWAGCLAGASLISDLEKHLKSAGFVDIKIAPKDESRQFIKDWAPGLGLEDYVISANITARKP